jgi:hypothetical protein
LRKFFFDLFFLKISYSRNRLKNEARLVPVVDADPILFPQGRHYLKGIYGIQSQGIPFAGQ